MYDFWFRIVGGSKAFKIESDSLDEIRSVYEEMSKNKKFHMISTMP